MSGVALILVAVAAPAGAQGVDTSEWSCEFCPFEQGARSEFDVGAVNVSDDSAWFGNATGYDEEGTYADVDGMGTYTSEGQRISWTVRDLGLDSRSGELEGGRPGRYEYRLGYRELPRRIFDTSRTVFIESGVNSLTLPSGWVRAPQTSGLSALDASLVNRNIESDRQVVEAGGSYEFGGGFAASADYRYLRHDGVKIVGAASFTNSSLLPMPFEHETGEVDFSLSYRTRTGQVSLGWYLSDFSNFGNGIEWAQPFTTAAGAETPVLARAPDSRFQQLSLRGSYAFPAYRTYVSASVSAGQIEQDLTFLPYTSNVNLATASLPRRNLGGEVDTQSIALGVTSRPLADLRLRLRYRFDERDNTTPRADYSRVIVDAFLSGELETNVPYSYERSKASIDGDYDLFDELRLSAGYERRTLDRDFQEVAEQTEDTGWGRIRWQALDTLDISAKGGASRRDIDRYDETIAAGFGQNPLLRKYNLAYRYREFGELRLAWSPLAVPVSIGLTGYVADDSYTRSRLGMTSAEERRFALDVGWTISERASAYLNAGVDAIESSQAGSESSAAPDWFAENEDEFDTIGVGFRIAGIAERIDLDVDYLRSNGTSEIEIETSSGLSSFPDIESSLDYLRLGLTYRRSAALDVIAGLTWQRFEYEDWALEGVLPDTLPTVLTLGAQPWDDDVLIVSVGVRYRPGQSGAAGN